MFKDIGPDSVWSGRTCPANLGVRSCPVRKLICPVRSSPSLDGARDASISLSEIESRNNIKKMFVCYV